MECGLVGLLGIHAQLHVVEELRQEHAPVLHHKMKERIAQDPAASSSPVTAKLVLVRDCVLRLIYIDFSQP